MFLSSILSRRLVGPTQASIHCVLRSCVSSFHFVTREGTVSLLVPSLRIHGAILPDPQESIRLFSRSLLRWLYAWHVDVPSR